MSDPIRTAPASLFSITANLYLPVTCNIEKTLRRIKDKDVKIIRALIYFLDLQNYLI